MGANRIGMQKGTGFVRMASALAGKRMNRAKGNSDTVDWRGPQCQ